MTKLILFYVVLIISLGISTAYGETDRMSDEEYKIYIEKYPAYQSAERELNKIYKVLMTNLSDESKSQLKVQ